ncbi:MAG: hypothetical protein Tsb0018_07840 [Opitutales bacterium]
MSKPFFYALPLLSAFIYAVSSLALKRAMELKAGAIRSVFMSNVMLGLCFTPLFFFSDVPFTFNGIEKPLIVSMAIFIGQLFTVTAIRVGDISVQGPVMGIKIVIVAALSVFLGVGVVSGVWWVAASLASFAIFLLGLSGLKSARRIHAGIFFAVGASIFFALEDVLIQKWASEGDFGELNFIAVAMLALAVESIGLIPFFRWSLRDIPKDAWHWLLGGSFLMGLQGIAYTLPIALVGKATVVNILYSSRGIWSIVLVWLAGQWFSNRERDMGKAVMVQRMVGALLLFLAIVLVLVY